nr:fimbrial biogenesis outer membrane usher protein [Pseudomonas brassicacearum subsp. brassicacearum]
MSQAKGLPAEFESHFFDVPLAVRIELNQQYLGEAMVVLSRDDRITLLEFTDTHDSTIKAVERDQWAQHLKQGQVLGACEGSCPSGLLAVHYSLENSLVSILTRDVERGTEAKRYYDQPEGGSLGLIFNNQLNINGGQEQDTGGRYGLNASSSVGNWSQSLDLQLSRLGGPDDKLYHAVHELHTQREMEGTFFPPGLFHAQLRWFESADPFVRRQPGHRVGGVMYGSSDSLAIENPKPSVYPIYVTASRQASVEIYRSGLLINTQAVSAGLQSLDTRPLPGGIYEVEVRLIEDGQTTATSQELVYKPNNWSDAEDRWRYNLFAGRETRLWSNWEDQPSGFTTAGVGLNYLLHPRVILGASTRQVQDKLQVGTSVDWTLATNTSLYANVYQTQQYGTGMDVQGLYSYGHGSVVASHNRSWLDTRNTYETLADGTRIRQRNVFVGHTSNSSLSVNHRLSNKTSVNGRLAYSEGNVQGTGLDLGWTQRGKLRGSDANWRLSVFDRPGTSSTADRRNRGVDLSVSVALGGPGEYWSGSIGTRTSRDGDRDHNASLTYRRDLEDHVLQSVSATALADTYGVGLSGIASFMTDSLYGDGFVQRSSYNDNLTGGLNLSSTVAVGGQKAAFTGLPQGRGAGMIVDVETDLDNVALRADDLTGGSTALRPGRNFVPITAYKKTAW